MPESTALKRTDLRAAFVPQPAGIAVLAVIVFAFAAGAARQELALTLAGAVFLLPWAYCLFMILILALIHSRRALRAGIRISRREIAAGETAEAAYFEEDAPQSGNGPHPAGTPPDAGAPKAGRKIAQLPGILVRCRLRLLTKDGRRIQEDFNPVTLHSFTVKKRGAYFSGGDEFAVFDSMGFFRFMFRLKAENAARLLASPRMAEEPPPVNARAGDSKLQPEFSLQRTDDLTEHRPYVPGDDPRRINWKLYGHGGGLFVREGENEPPPHSNILIFIDCEYDPALYGIREARRGIDLLCENALAAATACHDAGMDVQVAYSREDSGGGGSVVFVTHNGQAAAKAEAQPYIPPPEKIAGNFALPAAFAPQLAPQHVPEAAAEIPPGRGIVVFALPRSHTGASAVLDGFLNTASNLSAGKYRHRQADLFFLYGGAIEKSGKDLGILATAAEACAALYNRRPGVRAKAVGV